MKTKNSEGKVLTIFLVIIAVLLITLTALSMFFYNVEIDRRKQAEGTISTLEKDYEKANRELKELQKQNFLLSEKNKEADARINSLMDEVDLEKGLRDELKKESMALKEQVESLAQEKDKIENQTASQIGDIEQKVVELEAKLKVELNRNKELEKKNEELLAVQEKLNKITASQPSASNVAPKSTPAATTATANATSKIPPTRIDETKSEKPTTQSAVQKEKAATNNKMDVVLDQIIVTPDVKVLEPEELGAVKAKSTVNNKKPEDIPEGRVLSVDIETEFVVINLGEKHGLQKGLFLSVYRGNEYLGDIKVTRTQDEMAAADLVPPLSGKMLRKNDQVIAK
ncbi:MAG: hypothetical protein AB7S78_11080 [Candidatus Omnitrophota bacterium]